MVPFAAFGHLDQVKSIGLLLSDYNAELPNANNRNVWNNTRGKNPKLTYIKPSTDILPGIPIYI